MRDFVECGTALRAGGKRRGTSRGLASRPHPTRPASQLTDAPGREG
jgi:hypothetical protein